MQYFDDYTSSPSVILTKNFYSDIGSLCVLDTEEYFFKTRKIHGLINQICYASMLNFSGCEVLSYVYICIVKVLLIALI